MLLSCLGVSDDLFLAYMDEAIDRLNTNQIVRNLKVQINALESSINEKSERERKELMREFELHFGPSLMFKDIFVQALYYETVNSPKESKKEKKEPFPFQMSKEPIFG